MSCIAYIHRKLTVRYRLGNEPSTLALVFSNEENMASDIAYLAGLGKSDDIQISFAFNCYTETIP